MRPIDESHDPLLDKLTKHDMHHLPYEFSTHHGYAPHHSEWPSEAGYHADQSAEYDYFAGMFSKP